MADCKQLLFPGGGYRKLKSFQLAQLCFDITVRFVELYIPPHSRTTDQMVQAARSGVQNIAEGSAAAATSKKTELKLTNVARASLEELHLDFEDYLRQHSLSQWSKSDPLAQEFIKRRIASIQEFREFIQWALRQKQESVNACTCPLQSVIVANGVLLLLDSTCYFLDRQLARLSADFEKEGDFTERILQGTLKEARGTINMKKILICSLFTMILVATGGCISKEDLYGNWYSPQGYGDSRVIITENYWFTFGAPDKYFRKNIVIKSRYDVKDYGVFLRVTHSGFIDTVYNFFGFIVRDRTRYWLGFIPILGFQFSYKISDEEMLLFLQKYKFTRKQAMDELIILTDETSVPDQSIPPLINRLEE